MECQAQHVSAGLACMGAAERWPPQSHAWVYGLPRLYKVASIAVFPSHLVARRTVVTSALGAENCAQAK